VTDFDYAIFAKTCDRMLVVFQRRIPPGEREELTRALFTLLSAHDIEDVIAAGKRCSEKLKAFPKPVDWLAELQAVRPAQPKDCRTMRAEEAEELAAAAAMNYAAAPCDCADCAAAGVTDRPLRFVPSTFDGDEIERAFNGQRGQIEVVGHWAHGHELRRWYTARDHFFALKRRAPRALLVAVGLLVGEREPGMEG
jgi:hypothetical protein